VGRQALLPAVSPPAPEAVAQETGVVEPGALFLDIRRVASEILQCPIEHVRPEASFRMLGGTSLKAVDFLARLEDCFGLELPQRILFECRNFHEVVSFLGEELRKRGRREAASFTAPAAISDDVGGIAIVAVGGRFPGGSNTEEFWTAIVTGKQAITEVPPDR